MMELELCTKYFENSGYDKNKLKQLKLEAINKTNETISDDQVESDTIVFPLHYFNGVQELKRVVRSLETELLTLIGDVRVMFAMKKRSSIGNSVVRNKQLSFPNTDTNNQRCNGRGMSSNLRKQIHCP